MIILTAKAQGSYFNITIDGKVIKYWDEKHGKLWGGPLQYLPEDPKAIATIKMSRNKIPSFYIQLLKVSKEELEEFEKAQGEKELRDLVVKDLKKNGCEIVSEETK